MKETVELIVKFGELNHVELIDKEILHKLEDLVFSIPYGFNNETILYLPMHLYNEAENRLKDIDNPDADVLISAINSTGHELIYFIIRKEMEVQLC